MSYEGHEIYEQLDEAALACQEARKVIARQAQAIDELNRVVKRESVNSEEYQRVRRQRDNYRRAIQMAHSAASGVEVINSLYKQLEERS